MDLTIDTQTLKKALAIPKAAMSRNGPHVTVAGIRLVAADNTLSIEGTNIDSLASVSVPANVVRPGTAVLGLKDISLLLKGKGDVRLVADDNISLDFVNGMTTKVKLLDTDEWPTGWQSFTKAPAFELDIDHVSEVLPAASKDETRPILTGVMFKPTGEIIATDSYRLHIGYTHDGPVGAELLIPGGIITQVLKVVKAAKVRPLVRVAFLPTKHQSGLYDVQITAGSSTWYCHTLHGEYVNYEPLIPKSYPFKLVTTKAVLVPMLEKLNGIADKTEPVEITARPHGDTTLKHRNRSTDAVTAADIAARFEGPTDTTDEMTFAFTVSYLLDMVNACREETVVLGGTDPLKPWMIGESHPDGTRSIRLIMPVRLT